MKKLLLIPVAGLTLLSQGTNLTSLPVAPFVANFGPTTDVWLATDLSGSQPQMCLSLRQVAGEIPLREGTVRLDRGTFTFPTRETEEVGR